MGPRGLFTSVRNLTHAREGQFEQNMGEDSVPEVGSKEGRAQCGPEEAPTQRGGFPWVGSPPVKGGGGAPHGCAHTEPAVGGGGDGADGVEAEVAAAPVVVLLLRPQEVHLHLRRGG